MKVIALTLSVYCLKALSALLMSLVALAGACVMAEEFLEDKLNSAVEEKAAKKRREGAPAA